jgi:diguanylate cyclase (GGDEF)-like protein/PAS domain S-box-containing protein
MVLVWLWGVVPLHASAAETKHVLILHSYHEGLSWTDGVQAGMVDALAALDDLEIHTVYLDTKRYAGEVMETSNHAYLVEQRNRFRPDMVLVSDNNALAFLRKYRQELYPETPIVFCGINDYHDDLLDDQAWYAGVAEDTDAKATFQLMREVRPDLKRCIVLGDTTTTGLAELQSVRSVLGNRRDDIAIEYWSDRTYDDLCRYVAMLDARTDAVLLTHVTRDADGVYLAYEQAARRIADASTAPVFGMWDFYVGHGVLGGHMVSATEQGRAAGNIATSILQGDSSMLAGIIRQSPNRSIIDHDIMVKFGIDSALIPPDVLVINTPDTAWQAHDRTIAALVGGLAVAVLGIAGLAVLLVCGRRRRMTMEREHADDVHAIITRLPEAALLLDSRGRIRIANDPCVKRFDCEPDSIVNHPLEECWHRLSHVPITDELANVLNGASVVMDVRPRRGQGMQHTQSLTLHPLWNSDRSAVRYIIGILSDHQDEKEVQQALRKLQQAVTQMAASMVITDADGNIEYVNPAFESNTGYRAEDVLGKNPRILKSGNMSPEYFKKMWETLTQGRTWRGEIQNRRKNGSIFWELATIAPVRDEAGNVVNYVAVKEEISRQKSAEQRLMIAAHTDRLTGLANRAGFCDQTEILLKRTRYDTNNHIALLFLDVDRFKIINDSLGHEAGDMLLNQIAVRLCECLQCTDPLSAEVDQCVVARFGGDEFVILINDIQSQEDAIGYGDKIIHTLTKPYEIRGHDIISSVSLGIRLASNKDSDSVTDLLRDADMAMYEAKMAGRNRYSLFDDSMRERVQRRMLLETGLRTAEANDELFMVYQPIISVQTGNVTGYESLIRWQHPEFGLVSPMEFIPIAEENGLIQDIGIWALHTVCNQYKAWHASLGGVPEFTVNVNLSRNQLTCPGLVSQVKKILEQTGMPAKRLCLEVTESTVMQNPKEAVSILNGFKKLGIKLAMDDFGTGYSSLSCLTEMPVDIIKIDRSFIQGMCEKRDFAAMVQAVVVLAENLDLLVVGEGVETLDQFTMLQAFNCNHGQGYLFSKPLPASEVLDFKCDSNVIQAQREAA